jgi:hypothetical protein
MGGRAIPVEYDGGLCVARAGTDPRLDAVLKSKSMPELEGHLIESIYLIRDEDRLSRPSTSIACASSWSDCRNLLSTSCASSGPEPA